MVAQASFYLLIACALGLLCQQIVNRAARRALTKSHATDIERIESAHRVEQKLLSDAKEAEGSLLREMLQLQVHEGQRVLATKDAQISYLQTELLRVWAESDSRVEAITREKDAEAQRAAAAFRETLQRCEASVAAAKSDVLKTYCLTGKKETKGFWKTHAQVARLFFVVKGDELVACQVEAADDIKFEMPEELKRIIEKAIALKTGGASALSSLVRSNLSTMNGPGRFRMGGTGPEPVTIAA